MIKLFRVIYYFLISSSPILFDFLSKMPK